jgi:hypothetical protein
MAHPAYVGVLPVKRAASNPERISYRVAFLLLGRVVQVGHHYLLEIPALYPIIGMVSRDIER